MAFMDAADVLCWVLFLLPCVQGVEYVASLQVLLG